MMTKWSRPEYLHGLFQRDSERAGRRASARWTPVGLQARPAGDRLGPLRDDRRRPRPRPVRACGRDVPPARLVGRAPVAANARSWTPVLTCRERFAELSL